MKDAYRALRKIVDLVVLGLVLIGIFQPFAPVQAASSTDSIFKHPMSLDSEEAAIDPAELERFLDVLISERMEAYDIPSYTISVVQDGEIIFAKGYGYADVEKTVPVDAERTLFRICSVSKLFVWTSILQLVEQGRLDLNADVNTYLTDFQIPNTFPEPITIAHLLTHTSGFDKRDQKEFGHNLEPEQAMLAFLKDEMPERVYPPGQIHVYSNYGTILAVHIIEQVSGMPFNDYLEQNIFAPLGMDHTIGRQPLPSYLTGDMAAGYYWLTGFPIGEPGEFEVITPSGAITSNAVDMAKFMLAQLGTVSEDSQAILQPGTMELMHTTHFRFDPRLPGYTYGFFETYLNGQRVIYHNGGSAQFSATLTLLPAQSIGIFEAYSGGRKGSGFLRKDFISHYFPPTAGMTGQPGSYASPDIHSFQGAYRTVQVSQANFEKSIQFLNSGNHLTINEDGTLNFLDGRWIRIEPLTFQKEDSPELLVFKTRDGSVEGDICCLFIDNEAFDKLNWYEYSMFQYGLLGICLLVFLGGIFALPVTILAGRKRSGKPAQSQLLGVWLSWIVCFLNISFLVFVSIELFDAVFFGFSSLQKYLFLLPFLSILLSAISTALMVVTTARGKAAGQWKTSAKAYVLLITATGIAFTWWLSYWNLLGLPL